MSTPPIRVLPQAVGLDGRLPRCRCCSQRRCDACCVASALSSPAARASCRRHRARARARRRRRAHRARHRCDRRRRRRRRGADGIVNNAAIHITLPMAELIVFDREARAAHHRPAGSSWPSAPPPMGKRARTAAAVTPIVVVLQRRGSSTSMSSSRSTWACSSGCWSTRRGADVACCADQSAADAGSRGPGPNLAPAKRRSSGHCLACTTPPTSSSRARWACCSARRSSTATASQALLNGDEIFPAMLDGDPRRASRRSPSRPTSTGRATIGREFADALSERARAGVKVHVLLDWVGSEKMDAALLEAMSDGGRRGRALPPAALVHLARINNRTHRKLLVVDGTHRLHRRRRHRRRVDAATRRTPSTGATRTSASRARSSRRCRRRSWTTGSRRPARCCTARTTFPPLEPAATSAAQVFKSSPTGGSESMQLMYLLSIAAAERSRSTSSSAYFVPDDLSVRRAGRGARSAACSVRIIVPGEHIDAETRAQASRARWGELLAGGRRDLRVPADDVPLQGDDRRRPAGLGRLDQLRQPLVPPQRRGEPQRLRRRVRRSARASCSRTTWSVRSR